MSTAALSLQQVPDGQAISVYVVGGVVAATAVLASDLSSSGAIAQGSLVSAALARCADFVSAMGLGLAECLIVVQPDGRLSCLDVSGSPNFWRCPLDVQRHAVTHLATYLSEERSLHLNDSLIGADSRSHSG